MKNRKSKSYVYFDDKSSRIMKKKKRRPAGHSAMDMTTTFLGAKEAFVKSNERYKKEKAEAITEEEQFKVSKMKVVGVVQGIEIWIPLYALSERSRLISLSFCTQVSFMQEATEVTVIEMPVKIVKKVENRGGASDGKVIISDLRIEMHNRHLQKQEGETLTKEKLLIPSSISIGIDMFNDPSQHSNIMNLSVDIEPLDLKVGFREIDNFKGLADLIQDLMKKLQPQDKDDEMDLDEFQRQEYEKDIRFREMIEANVFEAAKNDDPQPEEVKSPVDGVMISSFKNAKDRKYFKQNHKDLNVMNVYFVLGSFNISLMDDTGLQEHPLVAFNINKVYMVFSSEGGTDNIVVHILKKMGIYKYPAMKMKAELSLSASYFNLDNGNYEPLIEPWSVNANIIQKYKNSLMMINAVSKTMLNINLTYGVALAVNQIMRRIQQSEEDWINELKIKEHKIKLRESMLSRNQTNKISKEQARKFRDGASTPDIEGFMRTEEETGFIFENNLELPMRITMEHYDDYTRDTIRDFSDLKKHHNDAVIDFEDVESEEGHYFRSFKSYKKIQKAARKILHKYQDYRIMDDPIIKIDVYIKGMEPIKSVPIEISGRRSFELTMLDEGKDASKKRKFQFVFVLDISQSGLNKIVSFESQVIITNETEFDICIAHALLGSNSNSPDEMTYEELKKNLKLARESHKLERESEFQAMLEKEDIILDTIKPNQEFRIPLLWFLERVAIYYK